MNASTNAGLYQSDGGHLLTRAQIIALAQRAGLTPEELAPSYPRVIKDTPHERVLEVAPGEHRSMIKLPNDGKYGVRVNLERGGGEDTFWTAELVNLSTGNPIPPDEPVMIFRAQDDLAVAALTEYVRVVTGRGTAVNTMTAESAFARLDAFENWALANPERVKLPS